MFYSEGKMEERKEFESKLLSEAEPRWQLSALCASVLPPGRGSSSRVPSGGLQAGSDRDGAG